MVVLIALAGFREWRSALLMAVSIPIALGMTFGIAHVMNIDLQQVSIATLIIALGLLVDDPETEVRSQRAEYIPDISLDFRYVSFPKIGGLAVATFITLLLAPVFCRIAVLDLKIVKWTRAS